MRTPRAPFVVLVVALVAAGCGLLDRGNVFELAVGDCFDDPGIERVNEVEMVDCAQAHDNEVFHVVTLTGEDFPGEDDLFAQAQEACLGAFTAYVGSPYETSRLDVFPITPSLRSWEEGDRDIVCSLYDVDGDELEGSMRDSGR